MESLHPREIETAQAVLVHQMDQDGKGVLLGHVHQKNAGDVRQALAVADLAVVRRVRLENIAHAFALSKGRMRGARPLRIAQDGALGGRREVHQIPKFLLELGIATVGQFEPDETAQRRRDSLVDAVRE